LEYRGELMPAGLFVGFTVLRVLVGRWQGRESSVCWIIVVVARTAPPPLVRAAFFFTRQASIEEADLPTGKFHLV